MADKTTAFTGPVVVGLNDKKGEIRLTDGKNVNEAKYLAIAAPNTITSDTTLTFPNGAGTAGQILSTDGNGTLSWVNDSAGNPDGSNGQVQFNDNGTFGAIPDGTAGQVLKSNGAGVAPSFQTDASGIAAVVDDTTPQLGGNLDLNGNDITGTGNINYTGALNASGSTIKLDGNYPTGTNNVALGNTALDSLTSGNENTAIGANALTNFTTQSGSTAVGYNAASSSTGGNNTAIGSSALNSNVTGTNNTVVGKGAARLATSNNNVAVGHEALDSQDSGFDNTAIGQSAGSTITSGSNLTVLGHNAQPSSATATNEITLGDANVTSVRMGNGDAIYPASGGGGISWQPVITTNTTATASQGFFVNTSGGAVTLTLPATPSQGDEVAFVDYAGTAATDNITIGRNGENIQGSGSDLIINTNRAANTLVYADATQGWLLKNV